MFLRQHDEKIKLFRKIYQLSTVGLSLREILLGVGATGMVDPGKIAKINDALTSGASFSEALKVSFRLTKHEEATLYATQVTGNLTDALKSIVEFYAESATFKKELKKALMMPAISLIMAILVLVGVTTFVIPQIEKAMPMKTTPFFMLILKDIGLIVPYLLGIVPFLLLLLGYYYFFNTYTFWKYLMKLPIAGTLYSLSAFYNYFTVVTLLMQGGVSFNDAFSAALEDSNAYISENISTALINIRAGESVRQAFMQAFDEHFPFYIFEMLDNAERSGNYVDNMGNIKALLKEDFTDTKNAIIPIITSTAIASVALVVVIAALSVIMPMQEVSKNIFNSTAGGK